MAPGRAVKKKLKPAATPERKQAASKQAPFKKDIVGKGQKGASKKSVAGCVAKTKSPTQKRPAASLSSTSKERVLMEFDDSAGWACSAGLGEFEADLACHLVESPGANKIQKVVGKTERFSGKSGFASMMANDEDISSFLMLSVRDIDSTMPPHNSLHFSDLCDGLSGLLNRFRLTAQSQVMEVLQRLAKSKGSLKNFSGWVRHVEDSVESGALYNSEHRDMVIGQPPSRGLKCGQWSDQQKRKRKQEPSFIVQLFVAEDNAIGCNLGGAEMFRIPLASMPTPLTAKGLKLQLEEAAGVRDVVLFEGDVRIPLSKVVDDLKLITARCVRPTPSETEDDDWDSDREEELQGIMNNHTCKYVKEVTALFDFGDGLQIMLEGSLKLYAEDCGYFDPRTGEHAY